MDTSSYGGDGPLILGLSWSFCIVATLLVVARACTAATYGGRLRWDFIWITVAYVLALIAQILITFSVLYGLGNHIGDISVDNGVKASLYNWTAEMIIIIDIGIAKIAIIAFLLMIQGNTHPKMRYFLHFIWITNMIVNWDQIILILLQCKPLPKFWNNTLEGTCDFRPTTSKVGFFQGGWGAASDLALAIYPVFIYWSLQMSWRMKLGLCCLTGGGVIAAAAAILKTIYIAVITVSDDPTYAFSSLVIWLYTELWLIIILSSIPPLRQFFARIYRKTTTVMSQSGRSTVQDTGERRVSDWQLQPYPHDLGHKARIGRSADKHKSTADTTEMVLNDGDSEENILPAKGGEIWVTRDTVVSSHNDDGEVVRVV